MFSPRKNIRVIETLYYVAVRADGKAARPPIIPMLSRR